MLLTIAKDPKLHRLLPKRSISSPIRTSKARQMTTTHRLALLYTLLTAYFISQTCAAQPIVQKCVVSNKTFMLTMYSKDMSLCLALQLPLWPNGTSANKDDGYALHKPLQQPSNQVRLHQQKPTTQHQQCPTQAGKRKVSSSTLILMCMPPLSSHSMQAACYKAHTRSENTSTNKVREYKILKQRESERRHDPPQTHHEKATETPRN